VDGEGTVTRSIEVTPGNFLIEMAVESVGLLPSPRPGQFYMVDCFDGEGGVREHVLRRPLSVNEVPSWMSGSASVSFLVEVTGAGTRSLCSMPPGSRVRLLGPLGVAFDISSAPVLMVAGGMGIAPLFFAARVMDERGAPYELMAGFKTGASVYPRLGELKGEFQLWTDDGSEGVVGMVSDGVERKLSKSDFSSCLACGPEAMMAHVAALCEEAGVPCQVSLVSRMACGTGACRGCVRAARSEGNICVCSEGPVFDSRRVVFHGSDER
jgi:dihydroorotate dehydrogenase electron transfer subunit